MALKGVQSLVVRTYILGTTEPKCASSAHSQSDFAHTYKVHTKYFFTLPIAKDGHKQNQHEIVDLQACLYSFSFRESSLIRRTPTFFFHLS